MPAIFEQVTEYKANQIISVKDFQRDQATLLRRREENRLTDEQLDHHRETDIELYEYFMNRRKQEKQ